MPCSDHVVLLKATAWSEHGKCQSDADAMCKSNENDTFKTLSGMEWKEKGMGTASYV